MESIKIHLHGDGCWPDLKSVPMDQSRTGYVRELAYLEGGMSGGNPSVTLRCTMDDGSFVLVQTSARLLITAAAAVKGKCEMDGIDV